MDRDVADRGESRSDYLQYFRSYTDDDWGARANQYQNDKIPDTGGMMQRRTKDHLHPHPEWVAVLRGE